MIIKKYLPVALSGILFLTSCSRNDNVSDNNNPTTTPDQINNFVWKAMNSWYYWQPNVPNLADNISNNAKNYAALINNKTPDKLFYSLLYNYGTTDRFSWIENNNEIVQSSAKAEIQKTNGLDFTLYQKDAANINRVALINYVLPGSPAALAGLKRGDVITKVNGNILTVNNSVDLFNTSYTVTIAATVQDTTTGIITTDGNTISLTNTDIDVNPIAFYKSYPVKGKTVGYLVYNGFDSDYNDELNATFAQMKADGVNELILDLRYNGGGSVESALALAQMITGQFPTANNASPYIYYDFNNKHNNEDGYDYLSDKVKIYSNVNHEQQFVRDEAVNSLKLSKVYILQSVGTASASELTIDALRKYISVVTIGYESVGKHVGSITLYDSPKTDWTWSSGETDQRNKTHNWKIQPITFAYFNKDKDPHPTAGIIPQYVVNPYDYFNTIKEFGDVSDPALKKAMDLISGTGKTVYKSFGYSNTAKSAMIPKDRMVSNGSGLNIDDFARYKRNK